MSTDRAGLFCIRACNCNLTRLSRLLRILQFHTHDLNVVPSDAAYIRPDSGQKRRLRFTKTGDAKMPQARRWSTPASVQTKCGTLNYGTATLVDLCHCVALANQAFSAVLGHQWDHVKSAKQAACTEPSGRTGQAEKKRGARTVGLIVGLAVLRRDESVWSIENGAAEYRIPRDRREWQSWPLALVA
jgi:hypothetical protein